VTACQDFNPTREISKPAANEDGVKLKGDRNSVRAENKNRRRCNTKKGKVKWRKCENERDKFGNV
jgi:hypothetical protein